ncbi:MAG: ATP-dependent zinc metalloprotease FtsH [Acidobacteria bacterium]|nr:ATP-dependent zinc metalloprotease FtsH [Acidobacteriota bacterium]
MSTNLKNILVWLAIVVSLILLWQLFYSIKDVNIEDREFSSFYQDVTDKKIKTVKIMGEDLEGEDAQGQKFKTVVPPDAGWDLVQFLQDNGVAVDYEKSSNSGLMYVFLSSWLPFILLIGFWIFLMRQMQSGGNKALSFGKSRARLLSSQQKKITFKDVAGVEEAKEELTEIIEFLKEPQKFQKLGGRIPKGVLLMGPPGTGKTLLARSIAGEANVPFFSISGSDFVEMFVGVGASRVRDLFEQGKKNAPCIIFIDEIDAVGRHRGAGLGGGHDEREQTLNQLLVEMDGFESNDGVILIAASNRPDVLDPALLRPGRFDRQVVVPLPDIRGREGIIKVHTRKIPISDDVEISVIARGTPGFSGAALANLVNEAALNAARYSRKLVAMSDFEGAKDKVLMGKERKSMVITEKDKKVTAYHEAGHALVAYMVPGSDPLHKVTIIPRGMALGLTQQLPETDKHNYTKEFVEGQIAILMGGRCAERIFLDMETTGAANDIEVATERARKMVTEWGMSPEMGPLAFGKKEEQIFLGREISQHRDYSEDTAIRIDREVKRIVEEGYSLAWKTLEDNRETLVRLAESLLEFETLDSCDIEAIIKGKPLKPRTAESSDSDSKGKPEKEKPSEDPSLPQLINPKGKPAPA